MTPRQSHALLAIKTYFLLNGCAPSYKQLGANLGVQRSQVDRLVKQLAHLGCVRIVRKQGVRTELRLVNLLAEVATASLVAELAARAVPITSPDLPFVVGKERADAETALAA